MFVEATALPSLARLEDVVKDPDKMDGVIALAEGKDINWPEWESPLRELQWQAKYTEYERLSDTIPKMYATLSQAVMEKRVQLTTPQAPVQVHSPPHRDDEGVGIIDEDC